MSGEIKVTPEVLQEQGAIWLRNAADFHGSAQNAAPRLQAGVEGLAHPSAAASLQAFSDKLNRTLVSIALIKRAMGHHLIAAGQGYHASDEGSAHTISGGGR